MSGRECSKSARALVAEVLKHPRYKRLCGKVRKYRCRIESEDLLGELNRGIAVAMHSVKMTRGSPMEYLLSRGFHHVQSVVSRELNHSVIEECASCHKRRPYRREPCTTCGGRDFLLHPRYVPLVLIDSGVLSRDDDGQRLSQLDQDKRGADDVMYEDVARNERWAENEVFEMAAQVMIHREIERESKKGRDRRANQRLETDRRELCG